MIETFFEPVLGMPQVVAFVVQYAVAIMTVASLAFTAYSAYQASQFESPRGLGAGDQTVMVQQSDLKRRFALGITRLGMVVFERAKPTPESDVLHFAGLFCQGPSEVEYLYWGEDMIALEVTGTDSNSHDIYEPKSDPVYFVETRWMGTSEISTVADQAALDAVGETHESRPVMRKFKVDSSKFKGFMEVRLYDGTQTYADATMVAELDHWTTSHKLTEICYAALKLTKNREVFTNGVENISARIKGVEVLDPRDDSTAWTQNPALLWHWWKTNQVYGRGVPTTDIDMQAVQDAADICDAMVDTIYSGTEPRYSVHGLFDTGMEPEVFEKDLKQAMDGFVANLGGMETVIPGHYEAPTFTITQSHAVGRLTSKTRLPQREQVEVVKGTYYAPDNSWKRTTFPASKLSADIVTDEKVVNLDLRLVSSPSQAQRLATAFLKRGQLERRMEGTFSAECFRAISGKPVQVEFGDRFGMSGKPAVVMGWGISVDKDGALNVSMNLRETASTVYDFNHLTEETAVTVGTKTEGDAPTTLAPESSPSSGVVLGASFPIDVTLTSDTAGAVIRWSKTADIPTDADGTLYTGAVSVLDGGVLFARAFKDGFVKSSLFVGAYSQSKLGVLQVSLAAGEYADGYFPDDVTLTSPDAGSTIRWSLSTAVDLVTDGAAYTGAITIPTDGGTLRARAFSDGFEDSEELVRIYTETA
jgi:hypothetical protein